MDKKDISLLIGNALDKFDGALYGFLAPVLAPIFFPNHDHVMQLILSYATSLIAVIARPLGTFIFGMFAQSWGPVRVLSYSLMGVAVATVMIGCIPGYNIIGWYAPLILVLVRCVRGVFAAGESTIAKLYIMENKEISGALRASYCYQSSSMMGIIVASGCATAVIGFEHYAVTTWRLCFFVGGITGFAALYMRYCAGDSRIKEKKTVIFKEFAWGGLQLLLIHKKNVARVALVTVFSHMTYSVPFVFMNSFIPLITDISLQTMMIGNTSLLVFDMAAVIVVGCVIARFRNIQMIMALSSGVLACTIVPLFYYLPRAPLWYVMGVRMWIVVCGVVFLCPLNVWCSSLFKGEGGAQHKYFLVGMGSAIGAGTLGCATVPLCLWLWHVTGCAYMPAVYVACVMGFVAWDVSNET